MSKSHRLPLISVIIPAFNEEALLQEHALQLIDYLSALEHVYRWEVLIVNDGSADRTAEIADALAMKYSNVRALHHPVNFGLGQVLRFGFANSKGDFVVVLDCDLSYDVGHVAELVEKMRESRCKIVLASPYMDGGTIKNVPWLRRMLSIYGNRFLRFFVRGKYSTLTGMVRAYDGPFIRSLDLRSTGMDIMPEAIYKSMVVHARIEEIPGRLDWGPQIAKGVGRTSSLRLIGHVISTVLSGFLFRPFLFFVIPGIMIAVFAVYVDYWMFVHFVAAVRELSDSAPDAGFTDAFALAYSRYPHTYVTALLSTMLAIQLIGLGVITLQSKKYFEDLFHQGSSQIRRLRRPIE